MSSDIELDVAGQRLKIRTDEDEAYMRRLAEYVGEHMKAVGAGQRGTTTLNVAILAALRIADEYHKVADAESDIDRVLESLAVAVEAALDQG